MLCEASSLASFRARKTKCRDVHGVCKTVFTEIARPTADASAVVGAKMLDSCRRPPVVFLRDLHDQVLKLEQTLRQVRIDGDRALIANLFAAKTNQASNLGARQLPLCRRATGNLIQSIFLGLNSRRQGAEGEQGGCDYSGKHHFLSLDAWRHVFLGDSSGSSEPTLKGTAIACNVWYQKVVVSKISYLSYLCCALSCAGLLSCGGSKSKTAATDGEDSSAVRAAQAQMLEYDRPEEEREAYTTRTIDPSLASPLEVSLRTDLTAMRPLRPDGNLDAFARWVLRETAKGREPNGGANAFAASWLGLPDTNLVLTTFGGATPAECQKSLHVQAAEVLRVSRPFTHYGIAEDCKDTGYGALVLSARHAEISDVSIENDDARARFEVTLHQGWSGGEVIVTSPTGNTQTIKLKGLRDRAEILMPREGRYQVEITALGDHGPALLYNFAIYAGIDRPERWLEAPEVNEAPKSPAEVEAQLHAMVNRERARRGLTPLIRDPQIDTVARAHSREMAKLERVAHHSPTTGTHHDRLKAAGMSWPISVENLARARNGFSACQGLMDSPAHRAGLLDPNVTHVGVGGVMDNTEETVFLTWVAVGEPNVNVDDLIDNAREHVEKSTSAKRVGFLDKMASAFVEAYVNSDQPMEAVWNKVPRNQDEIARRYQALHPHLFMKNTNDMETGDFEGVARKQHYGLAAARSGRADDPKGAIQLIVIFGLPR